MIIGYKGYLPKIHESAYVSETVDLIGQIKIGEEASVWFGTVIRGDLNRILIGKGSNIQDGSVIHVDVDSPTIIGDFVTVGHNSIIHGCTLENNVLVGMGSTILDDAVISENSIVGANSLVTKGKVFPPKSLILGSPAKLIRTLTDDEVVSIQKSADLYINLSKNFKYE